MATTTKRPASAITEGRTADVYRVAAELIVQKGFGGTSIGDISKAVGMTKAGLYHHISGKQDMLYQIMNYALDKLNREVIKPVQSIKDPEERLRKIMHLHLHGSIRHGLSLTSVMWELNHLEPAQRKKIVKRKKEYNTLIREALRELEEKGQLRNLDINIATMHIVNTLLGIAHWFPNEYLASDEELLIEQTVEYNMAAILKPKSRTKRQKKNSSS